MELNAYEQRYEQAGNKQILHCNMWEPVKWWLWLNWGLVKTDFAVEPIMMQTTLTWADMTLVITSHQREILHSLIFLWRCLQDTWKWEVFLVKSIGIPNRLRRRPGPMRWHGTLTWPGRTVAHAITIKFNSPLCGRSKQPPLALRY